MFYTFLIIILNKKLKLLYNCCNERENHMPRKKQPISFDDVLNIVPSLSTRQIQQLITQMQHSNLTDKQKKNLTKIISNDLDTHAEKLGLGKICPKCGSVIIKKDGRQANGLQRLKCNDCGHRFSYFSNTILDKTHFSWEMWTEFIYLMLLNSSLTETTEILKTDFGLSSLTRQTVLTWRLKILECAKEIEQPTLSGIIETDETSFHENQKGSRELINPLDTTQTRKARKTSKASKYGALGPEFGTVICAVDHTGHTVSKYVGVGRASMDAFEIDVASHFKDVTHLCSDANNIYSKFCNNKNVVHYVRPSNYLERIKNGRKAGKTDNDMYNNQEIDYIEGRNLSYAQFKYMKDKYKLSLAHVNQVHSRLKQKLVHEKHGITLKNIDGYVCWETMLINYTVDNGHSPTTRKDAERILEMLLLVHKNVLIKEIRNRKCDFSSMNPIYQQKLIDKTDEYRKTKMSYKEYISSEDMGDDFNLRDFLDTLPIYMLKFLCDYCKIKGRTKLKKGCTYKFKRALEIHPDVQNAIDALIQLYGTKKEE